jgi:excisionase family DNA binding protein
MPDARKDLSVAQFAREIGTRMDTIYALIWVGKIRARKVRGRWRIPRAELDKRRKARLDYQGGRQQVEVGVAAGG